jgi:hypothetical protein
MNSRIFIQFGTNVYQPIYQLATRQASFLLT